MIFVSVFERSSSWHPQSSTRLLFLGRLRILPVLSVGATGYFAYLSDRQKWRSAVVSELSGIMTAAGLDNTYYILDWFMKKDRLIVYVGKRASKTRSRTSFLEKRLKDWIRCMHIHS